MPGPTELPVPLGLLKIMDNLLMWLMSRRSLLQIKRNVNKKLFIALINSQCQTRILTSFIHYVLCWITLAIILPHPVLPLVFPPPLSPMPFGQSAEIFFCWPPTLSFPLNFPVITKFPNFFPLMVTSPRNVDGLLFCVYVLSTSFPCSVISLKLFSFVFLSVRDVCWRRTEGNEKWIHPHHGTHWRNLFAHCTYFYAAGVQHSMWFF